MYCVALLRDLGAEIVLVERPSHRADADRYAGLAGQFAHDSRRRGCVALAIDLRSERGGGLFLRMTAVTDVVLEGFRPGVSSRLGIDFDAVRKRTPRIVYAAISGFGQDGPAR